MQTSYSSKMFCSLKLLGSDVNFPLAGKLRVRPQSHTQQWSRLGTDLNVYLTQLQVHLGSRPGFLRSALFSLSSLP